MSEEGEIANLVNKALTLNIIIVLFTPDGFVIFWQHYARDTLYTRLLPCFGKPRLPTYVTPFTLVDW